jgi:hypothetical protein
MPQCASNQGLRHLSDRPSRSTHDGYYEDAAADQAYNHKYHGQNGLSSLATVNLFEIHRHFIIDTPRWFEGLQRDAASNIGPVVDDGDLCSW